MRLASGTASFRSGDEDDRAEIAPACCRRLGAVQRLQLALDRALRPPCAKRRVVGDQDRLRAGVVLGLRQQVGGDPVRIVVPVGDDKHFGRAGDHVDADRAEDLALGGGDIGIARAGDLGDRARSSPCHRQARRRLRAADAVDLVDAGDAARRPAPPD